MISLEFPSYKNEKFKNFQPIIISQKVLFHIHSLIMRWLDRQIHRNPKNERNIFNHQFMMDIRRRQSNIGQKRLSSNCMAACGIAHWCFNVIRSTNTQAISPKSRHSWWCQYHNDQGKSFDFIHYLLDEKYHCEEHGKQAEKFIV